MKLPGILQEIADAAGIDAALKIAKAKGGTNVCLPGVDGARRDCWLTRLVGEEAAVKIALSYGPKGGRVDIPLGPFSRSALVAAEIRRRLEAAESVSEIARAVGCGARAVYRHKERLREEQSRQAPTKGNSPC
jgi:hypothetical protein